MTDSLIIRQFTKLLDYQSVWKAMRQFTDSRDKATVDELWLLEHPPVFTQGQAGKPEHLLNPDPIPVVHTDRGGQVTYHGPGQLIAYILCDIKRLGMGPRTFVRAIEHVVIDCLKELSIPSEANEQAPGVYVDHAKIASIGLRIRRGGTYHGLAFNIDMDLTPFSRINPCGQRNLRMTQVKALSPQESMASMKQRIIPYFLLHFGYNQPMLQSLPSITFLKQ